MAKRVKVVPKVWGEERWLVNNRLYCGKLMILKRGFRCSLHMHKVKDETFFVRTGRMLFEIEGPAGASAAASSGRAPSSTCRRVSGTASRE